MTEQIGPTGKFPDGKIDPTDEGEIKLAIGKNADGYVVIDYGKQVVWVAMPPADAINIARAILKAAGVKKVEIEL